jgi:aminoglycoside phosphotransferase (APT) family kinase protein
VGLTEEPPALAVHDYLDPKEHVADVDIARLRAFLDQVGLGAGPLHVDPIGDGHSNLTYRIKRDGGEWVLRRPPRGPLPPSAHDVLREFRILRACAGHVRVPKPVIGCADSAVVGAPFYVMGYVDGEVITTDLPAGHDALTDPARVAAELVAALAEIHDLDWQKTDLRGLTTSPDGYLDRQLHRFSKLWIHNRTRDLRLVDRVATWLTSTRPESTATALVHGDYRLGNTVFSRNSPAVLLAVLDWELATIGDPLADVGYLSATWANPDPDSDPLVRLGSAVAGEGFPSRGELVELYGQLTGRSLANLRWYEVFALWKSAVFLEGSYARLLSGTTRDPFFASLKAGVPALVERAWRIACDSTTDRSEER